MKPLEKTVTARVQVDWRIADLVYFVKSLQERPGLNIHTMTDDHLIAAAEDFWDTQHGED